MPKRRKSKTLAGQRVPVEMVLKVRKLQEMMRNKGKKVSLQDTYRMIARRLRL